MRSFHTRGSPASGRNDRPITRSDLIAASVCVCLAAFAVAYPRQERTLPNGRVASSNGRVLQSCYEPLASSYTSPDRTYSTALAEAQRLGESGQCFIADSGRCGALRFVRVGDGFVLNEEYFDGERLVAVRAETDDLGNNPECLGWTHYGERLTCRIELVAKYCKRMFQAPGIK